MPEADGREATDMLRRAFTQRRELLGYGQRKVATAMQVNQSVVSDLETGRTANPGLDTLSRWAAALHASLSVSVQFEEITVPARTETIKLS